MVDSVQVFPPGFRVVDTNGNPVSGAKIKFKYAGPGGDMDVFGDADLSVNLGHIVYTRSDGFPVVSSGSSTTTMIYVGSDAYWVEITDSDDVAIYPAKDDVRGALNTTSFLTSGSNSTLSIPVAAVSADLTLDSTHRGKLINCDPSSATFTLTMTSAVTLGDGWNCEIKHKGTTNYVRLTASQNFEGPWGTKNSFTIEPGETVAIRCDGATFKVISVTDPFFMGGTKVIPIVSRVASAPGSPTARAKYICTGIFTAGGVTTAVGDIIEATGQSTFIKITPPATAGWVAFVQDEAQYYSWYASAWRDTLDVIATQAEMEAGSASNRMVTPARQKHHPAHPKLWSSITFTAGTPAVTDSHGVSSVNDDGTGDLGLNCSTAFSNSTYAGNTTITSSLSGQFGGSAQFGRTSASIVDIKLFTGTSSANPTLIAADYNFTALAVGDQ